MSRIHINERRGLLVTGWLFALLAQATPRAESQDALRRGNEAFLAGKYAEAIELYESDATGDDLLVRRFNAGVSAVKAGDIEKASERFEDVSSRADGSLRSAALYNAGCALFERARSIFEEALKAEPPPAASPAAGAPAGQDGRVPRLAEAARTYRQAIEFFRQIEPPDESTESNVAIAKTALRAVLDEIARIEEEARKREEEQALKSPTQLLEALLAKEKIHRTTSRAIEKQRGSQVRLGCRRLRKSTAESRILAEKLLHSLSSPAPAQPAAQPGQPPGPVPAESEDEKLRREKAAQAVEQAIAAMKEAEIAYGDLKPGSAGPQHSKAIVEFRGALEAFPLDVARVIQQALATQESVHGSLDQIVKGVAGSAGETGGAAGPQGGKGTAAGKGLVDVLTDNVLRPLAKVLSPEVIEGARALADEEDDVVWGAGILSRAEIPPSPQATPPAAPGAAPPVGGAGAAGEGGGLDAEQAKKLSEALRKEGQTALGASTSARDELRAGRVAPALPPATEALEALRRAADLLPKPPKTPEERLRELIARQRSALEATQGLPTVAVDLRDTARLQIVTGQRTDGREAGDIATALEARNEDRPRKAAEKTREGEGLVHASAESIQRDRLDEAGPAIERGIRAFEEALALLSENDQDSKQDQDDSGQDQKPQQDPKQDQQDEGTKQQQEQSQYVLTPRDAEAQREKMDRDRREEESKLFVAPSGVTVKRDW